MNRLFLSTFMILDLLLALPLSVSGADTKSLTVTENRGLGVNQPNNRTFITQTNGINGGTSSTTGPLSADTPMMSSGGFCCFPDTSNPFLRNSASPRSDGSVDPLLPPSFATPDNQFGKGAPCGPTDTNGNPSQGIPFPYPCSSNGNMQLSFFNLGTAEGVFSISAPALAPGNPFQSFVSTPMGGGFRQQKIEFGFTQNSGGSPSGSNMNAFFSITTLNGPDGHLVGWANGKFITSTSGVAPLSCDKTFTGTFQASDSGMDAISCKNSDGTSCQNVQSIPDLFSRNSSAGFCQ